MYPLYKVASDKAAHLV